MPLPRTLILLSILLALSTGPADEVARWAPEVGERVEWRWRVESEFHLSELVLEIDSGNSNAWRRAFDDAQLDVRDTLVVTARDRIVERDDYDPTRLARELVRARRTTSSDWALFGGSASEDNDELETVSPFEGARLDFAGDPSAGESRASLVEDSDDSFPEQLLPGLDEGLDLRGLTGGLPREVGDRWYLHEDDLLKLVRPGGELALAAPEHDFVGEHESATLGWLLGAALVGGEGEGWGVAELIRVEWDGGRRIARIGIRAGIEVEGSVFEALERLIATLGSGSSWLEYGRKVQVEHAIRLQGELLWDLEHDRAHALDLEGRSESRLELEFDFSEVPVKLVAEVHGELRVRVDVAVQD